MTERPTPTRMVVTAATTVLAAREFVALERSGKDGCRCPACGAHRILKAYRVNRPIARSLGRLYWLFRQGDRYVHRSEFTTAKQHGNDITVLRFHRLIVTRPAEPGKPFGRSGFWTISTLGAGWVRGEIERPVAVYVDDNKRVGFSEETWTFNAALQASWNPEDAYERETP